MRFPVAGVDGSEVTILAVDEHYVHAWFIIFMFVSLVIISVFIAIILNYYGIQVTPLAMTPSHDPDPNPSHHPQLLYYGIQVTPLPTPSHDPTPNPSHPPPLLRHTDLPHHHLVTLPLPLSPTLPLALTLTPTLALTLTPNPNPNSYP